MTDQPKWYDSEICTADPWPLPVPQPKQTLWQRFVEWLIGRPE